MSNSQIQHIIKEYLQYFQWLLEKDLTTEELDYMFHLRDRIEEAKLDLGDLDNVLQMNAKLILKHKSLFEQPMSNSWWWKRSAWEKLATKKTLLHFQMKRKPRTIEFAHS